MNHTGLRQDLTIIQGKTFQVTTRWATSRLVYRDITTVTDSSPVTLTVTNHGLTSGWRFAINGVQGMTSLNAEQWPPVGSDMHIAEVVDTNTLAINTIDGATIGTYASGGSIAYHQPVSLIGMEARMDIKDKVGGTILQSLHTDDSTIVLNNTTRTITLRLAPEVTETLTWKRGVYDLELFDGTDVFLVMHGQVAVEKEVTTSG